MPRLAEPKRFANVCAAMICFALCYGQEVQAHAAAGILKFGYILTPSSQLGRGEQVFAAEVARRTSGRYTIENYPNAMLGGEVAMMRDVQLGALDLAFI